MTVPLNVSGVISSMGSAGPQTIMFQGEVKGFTTDAEVAKFQDILKEKGQRELVDTLYASEQKGYVRIGPSRGYPIPVIRSKVLPNGGRRIAFAAARPLSFAGVEAGAAQTDYPIGIIEVTVGPDGKGEGKIYGMIQASFKDGELDLSSYSGDCPSSSRTFS